MAAHKTAIILGAGASNEVGLPIGAQLKTSISDFLDIRTDVDHPTKQHKILDAVQLIIRSGKNPEMVNWAQACEQIRTGMPQALSIDNYLHTHSGKSAIEGTAKLAIAAAILEAERHSKLFHRDRTSTKCNLVGVESTWLNKFFQILCTCNASTLKQRLSRITVISFNYDRCFEHFLHGAIQSYYNVDADAASDIMSSIKIYHPYGQVGMLPWQGVTNAVPFGADLHAQRIVDTSSQIKTFTEGTAYGTSEIDAIRQAIAESTYQFFLGFAYHPINMDLLAAPIDQHAPRVSKWVFGTALKSSDHDREMIRIDIQKLAQTAFFNEVNIKSLECSLFLDTYSRSFMKACS